MVSEQELEDLRQGLLTRAEEECIRLELLLRELIRAAEWHLNGCTSYGLRDAIDTAKAHLGDA